MIAVSHVAQTMLDRAARGDQSAISSDMQIAICNTMDMRNEYERLAPDSDDAKDTRFESNLRTLETVVEMSATMTRIVVDIDVNDDDNEALNMKASLTQARAYLDQALATVDMKLKHKGIDSSRSASALPPASVPLDQHELHSAQGVPSSFFCFSAPRGSRAYADTLSMQAALSGASSEPPTPAASPAPLGVICTDIWTYMLWADKRNAYLAASGRRKIKLELPHEEKWHAKMMRAQAVWSYASVYAENPDEPSVHRARMMARVHSPLSPDIASARPDREILAEQHQMDTSTKRSFREWLRHCPAADLVELYSATRHRLRDAVGVEINRQMSLSHNEIDFKTIRAMMSAI